jgi:hypothetical protein
VLRVFDAVHRMAGAPQRAGKPVGKQRIVFDDQQAHGSIIRVLSHAMVELTLG